MSQHLATDPADDGWVDRLRRPRRRGGRVAVVATVLVLALAGAAVALFFVLGGTRGSVTAADYEVELVSAQPMNGSTCTATADLDTDEVVIAWDGVVPGDKCVLDVAYRALSSNSGNLRNQGFVAPEGLTVVNGGCGRTLTPEGATSSGGVGVTLTVEDGFGGATLDPAVHGWRWVRAADYDPALCQ